MRAAADVLTVLVVLAAYTSGAGESAQAEAQPVSLPQAAAGPKEDVPSALKNMRDPAFPPPLLDPDKIRSGGPPPDGIPAIDNPTFLRASDVRFLGSLFADNLVMYDRQTESLWPQLTFTVSVGVLTGTKLAAHPLQSVSWRQFRTAHPDAWVLSCETVHHRDYGSNPYASYDNPDGGLLFPLDAADRRERLKERVIGIGEGAGHATGGLLAGTALTPVRHLDTF